MKKLMAAMAMMISMHAVANDNMVAGPSSNELLLSETVSTVFRTSTFTYDKNLDILVCPPVYNQMMNGCHDKDNKPQWRLMKSMVPVGRKFVGFKTFIYGRTEYIEIYIR